MKILVLNGPNLNLLGEREPEIYGRTTLREIEAMMKVEGARLGHTMYFFQSNHEGQLIDRLHEERRWLEGIVMNPGAFTHYSYALRDAVAALNKPTVEVHLSDLTQREEFRRFSVFEGLANVTRIMGKGPQGYLEALQHLAEQAVHSQA